MVDRSGRKIRVYLVEDQTILRESLSTMLGLDPDEKDGPNPTTSDQ